MTEAVLTEVADGVLEVILNRPDARNSLNLDLTDQLAAALRRLDSDPDLVAGVLHGAGDFFSAGMDLKAFLAGEQVWDGDGRRVGLKEVVTRPTKRPLIAAIEAAVALAHEIGANGPLAVAASKEILVNQEAWDDEEFWRRQGQMVDSVFGSADAAEGARAFAEKRPPHWRGE